MKDVSAAEQEKIFAIFEKNPDLFKKIAEEAQIEIKKDQDQTAAIMKVVEKYSSELQNAFGGEASK